MTMRNVIAAIVVLAIVALATWFTLSSRTEPETASTIAVRLPTFSLVLDPRRMSDTESRKVASALHAGLVAVDQDQRVVPMAAQSWRQRDGGTWEFVLKSNLKFSDGTPVTPEDVIASICAGMQPSSAWAFALASIAHEVQADRPKVSCTGLAVNNGKIEIKEARPSPWFLDGLAQPGAWILPQTVKNNGAPYGVLPGVGPYAFDRSESDRFIELRSHDAGAPNPIAPRLVFRHIADPALAANAFANKQLDVLEIDAPSMLPLLFQQGKVDSAALKVPGHLQIASSDRIRVVIVNEKRLLSRGFSPEQVADFKVRYSQAVDRQRLALLAGGLAEPLAASTPMLDDPGAVSPTLSPTTPLPGLQLLLITESDPFSDQIAAFLPSRVGGAAVRYQGLDKGQLITRLLSGDYDLAATVLEGTMHAPPFWISFFSPGSSFNVFGKPLSGIEKIDVTTPSGVQEAAARIDHEGNWIGLLREKRILLLSDKIQSVALTPSGQANLAIIH